MKRSAVWSFTLLVLAALCGACGDDDKDNESEGSPSTMSDASAVSTGDGGFVNAATCPVTAPEDDSSCRAGRAQCRYGATRCDCNQPTPFDPPGTWSCRTTMGPRESMCPPAEPAMGSACTPMRGQCRFGERVCDCVAGENTWACWSPAECPTAAPAERAACATVGMTCDIPQGRSELSCACGADGWDCGRQYCPPERPMVGAMCEGGSGTCTFADETCDCVRGAWSCWRASDCPMPAPADDSACTINGISCSYGGLARCSCDGREWNCSGFPRNPDAGVRRDGGMSNVVDAGGIDAAM